tara:strand:- start:818 stop:1315 length:498 start_codon:yes stop_codon:yes gene_type:complete
MRYQTIIEGIKLIVESHKSDLTFFSGLESDKDPANNVHYPLIFLPPPIPTEPLTLESISSNTKWLLHIESQELLSNDSTTQQKQEALDRTREYLRDVYYKFILNGFDITSVTFNNVTEDLDFKLDTEAPFQAFIDINDGVTGWMVDFTIQESDNNNLCHLDDVFN